MYKNILLPLDGSEAAEEAIPTAIDLARIFDAKITLIQIIEILSLMKEDREDESKILLERGDKYLNLIKERIEDNGGSANVVMETGKPSLKICEHAKHHVDLIILCSHGAGAFESWAVGSVCQKILRHSTKPVLLLKPPIVSPLKGKAVLVVDDEVDILEAVEEHLDMCIVYKASDYNSASQYLENRTLIS